MKSNDNYIITAIKSIYNRDIIYTAVSDSNSLNQILLEDEKKKKFKLYDEINFSIEENNRKIIKEGSINTNEYYSILNNIILGYTKYTREISSTINYENKELDKITKSMLQKLQDIAIRIIKNILTGAPIIVRFHNDADGCSGALALYKSLYNFTNLKKINNAQIFWKINKSIAYNIDSLYEDKLIINQYESIEKPLVLIIDFGTTDESEDVLKSKRNFDIIILDHHPIYEGFPVKSIDEYVNPWSYGGDSNYTAGFLASTLAKLISDVDVNLLMDASLIGDHSIYCNLKNKHAEKISIVLDYITGKRSNFSIKNTFDIIENNDLLEKNFLHSTSILESAISSALKKIKRYKGLDNTQIFVLNFGHIERIEDDFPLPGRFSSKLHDKIEELNGPNLTIVYYGNFISLRLSNALLDKLSMLKKLEALKDENEYVYSAGGHNAAASIRINNEHIKSILNDLLKVFGVNN